MSLPSTPRSLAGWLALALLCVVAMAPFHPVRHASDTDYWFEVRMSSSSDGEIRLYFDDGHGLREALAAAAPVKAGPEPREYRIPVPAGTYRGIRVDPINTEAALTLEAARLARRDGTVLRAFAAADFHPEYQIRTLTADGDRASIVIEPGGTDPQLRLNFDPSLELPSTAAAPVTVTLFRAALAFLLATAVLWGLSRLPALRVFVQRIQANARAHPRCFIVLLAVAAGVASCYPVVFLGRSFVSPNFSEGTYLLYPRFPTVPGTQDASVESAMGSDVGAIAWQHLPYSYVQHRALFEQGTLPWWNRYNSCGTTLLGQGQSMFGDPLHLVVIAFDGAEWAWDFKFVAARILFCATLGVLVLMCTGSLAAAALTTFSSAFLGYFLFRINHPAQFSFCYAPAILLGWAGCALGPGGRRSIAWALGLVAANAIQLASGTAKEAAVFLLTMNATGMLMAAGGPGPWKTRLARLGLGCGAALSAALITVPLWMVFLDTLADAHTNYFPTAFQIHPAAMLGFFDEIFFRPLHAQERVWNPSANFLVLAGLAFLLVTWRRSPPGRLAGAMAIAAAGSLVIVFGALPPRWIIRIPFIGTIGHIDATFGGALIIQAIVLAGFGYRSMFRRLPGPEGGGDIRMLAGVLALMGMLYAATLNAIHRAPWGPHTILTFREWPQYTAAAPFVWWEFFILPGAVLVFCLALRHIGRPSAQTAVFIATSCVIVMTWRFGQHGSTLLDTYVYSPAARVDLRSSSPAIEAIRSGMREPERVMGVGGTLFPGWSVAYRLESAAGADAVQNRWYSELLQAGNSHLEWDWRLSVAWSDLAQSHRFLDFLNVAWFVDATPPASPPPDGFVPQFSGDLAVFRNQAAWPRAFFTDQVLASGSAEDIARLIATEDGRPFAAMDPRELPPKLLRGDSDKPRAVVAATDYVLRENSTEFSIETPGPGIVVLHETWLPGCIEVEVDGASVPCLRVNHAFRGVAIEQAGRHRIRFGYRPRHWGAYTLVSGAGWLLVLGAGVFLLNPGARWRRAA